MDDFPFDLILTVAIAWVTIFLGFLPTKTIHSSFFACESLKAAFAWVLVACISPPTIIHYPFFFAFLCAIAWWNFSQDRALGGKTWLFLASGLGISLGVVLILAVTPRAYPPDLPLMPQTLLLASIYLGGAIIALGYFGSRLAVNILTNSGVTNGVVQRYVGLLVVLVMARAVGLVASVVLTQKLPGRIKFTNLNEGYVVAGSFSNPTLLLLGLVLILIPSLSLLAWRATRFTSRIQPTRFLLAICFFGILAEAVARLLGL